MHRIRLIGALVAASALCSVRATPERAVARQHIAVSLPATGLRAISLAHAPPDFAFRDSSGVVHLRELVGAPVVVNFWATWCEPCQAELETFARLRAAYGARVTLLAISAEAPGVARAYLAARHIEATAVDDDEHRIADSTAYPRSR